jgi:hypothetical protein
MTTTTPDDLDNLITPPQQEHWSAVAAVVEQNQYGKSVSGRKQEKDYWAHRFICRANNLGGLISHQQT